MNPDNSPFTLNRPVAPSGFVGRESQINRLIDVVRQARKNLQVAWIGGERGMGKSSLAFFIGAVAEMHHNALIAHVHLGGANELSEMVRQTYLDLIKDNQRGTIGRKMFDFFGDKVEKFGLFDTRIKLNLPPEELNADAVSFAQSLNKLRKQVGGDKKMVLLLLDDINGLAESSAFAHWIKSMATQQLKIPLCLVCVGLPQRLESIRKTNPSVVRMFSDLINIEPWAEDEAKDFFCKAFTKKGVEVDAEVLDYFAMRSGGIPTVAHEIGAQAWRFIEDKKLDIKIAHEAVAHAMRLIDKCCIAKEAMQALASANTNPPHPQPRNPLRH